MTVVITPPAAPVITATDAKVLVPSLADASDALVTALVDAATKMIDGPSGWLGRALVNQTLEWRAPCFPCWVYLPYPPIVSITSITYLDSAGEDQVVDSSTYELTSDALVLAYQKSWPSSLWREDSVRIRYVAGYGALGTNVPANIRCAVALMAAKLKTMGSASMGVRSETVDGVGSTTYLDATSAESALDGAVRALLGPSRVFA